MKGIMEKLNVIDKLKEDGSTISLRLVNQQLSQALTDLAAANMAIASLKEKVFVYLLSMFFYYE